MRRWAYLLFWLTQLRCTANIDEHNIRRWWKYESFVVFPPVPQLEEHPRPDALDGEKMPKRSIDDEPEKRDLKAGVLI